MTANGSNTKNELIKSHHEEAEEGQNAPIPAKATQTRIKTPSTKTEKKKAGSTTKTQAPTTTSSTTDRQAAPVVNDSSKKAKAKTSGKHAAYMRLTPNGLALGPYCLAC